MRARRKYLPRKEVILISSDWKIPLCDLDYDAEETAAVVRVLKSKWLSMGEEVESFEHEFAQHSGVKHSIAVSSGTAALHIAFQALKINSGDEIIQPAINFVAAANMTIAVGATPAFSDIVGHEEPTLDPEDVERLVTPHTKAVVVMHYGGHFCRMAEICEICRRHDLLLIEDACHAVGAHYFDSRQRHPHSRMAGNVGDVGCFSFFSNKNLAVGEGGMITTNDDELAQRMRRLRSHGMTTLTWDRHHGHASFYDVEAHGYNYRLDEIHAALGRVQLGKLDRNNAKRKELISIYHQRLSGLPGWTIPFESHSGGGAYHLMVIVAPNAEERMRALATLKAARIQTSLHYPCVPDFTAFARWRSSEVGRSRLFANRAITLPLYSGMSADQVGEICSVITECVQDKRSSEHRMD
jgi:dTDP-4-amino-4,6-dideoxygalactose transaminase